LNKPQDQSSESNDFLEYIKNKSCVLALVVNEKGELNYQINWSPDEKGLHGAASIFYNLIFDNLAFKIFEELREQCVLNDAEIDYLTISKMMNNFLQSQQAKSKDEDEVVVPPDQIFSI
jgi:hypothetical protein